MKVPALLAAICTLATLAGRGQQVIDVDKAGGPTIPASDVVGGFQGMIYNNEKFVRVTSGSAFFQDQFLPATLYDATGSRYKAGAVRLNLLDNQINYKDGNGTEMVTTTPIKRVVLEDKDAGKTYTFVAGDQLNMPDKSSGAAWVQVLVNKQVSLVLWQKKSIHKSITYAQATQDEDIPTVNLYYVKMNGAFSEVKSFQDLINQFPDKRDILIKYAKDNKLRGRTPEEYAALVNYYNEIAFSNKS